MTDDVKTIDPRELEAAFSLFNQASSQLASAYDELQRRVDRLAAELAVANGELKRQYLEKEALSERLRLLLDALPGGVVVLDNAQTVVEANPAARAWLGDGIVGSSWPVVMSLQLAATAEGSEWSVESASGERRLTMSESSFDASGGRILLLNDITESARLRRQLEHHQRLSAMGEMAAGLAHQLRTPLATALLYASNITRPGLPESERQRFGERVRERLRYLERMIQDMLQFVRGQPEEDEPIDVNAVVREVCAIIEPQMEQQGVAFRRVSPDGSPVVRGSRKALTGALVNLLENALQATPEGGEVRLSVALFGGGVSIAVADTGCGMPPGTRQRIFEPFFTTRSEGTGLGLAIVRSVAEAHGGSVSVTSEPGHGSEFVLRLPTTQEKEVAA